MAQDYKLKMKDGKLFLEPLKIPKLNTNRPKDVMDKFLRICPRFDMEKK